MADRLFQLPQIFVGGRHERLLLFVCQIVPDELRLWSAALPAQRRQSPPIGPKEQIVDKRPAEFVRGVKVVSTILTEIDARLTAPAKADHHRRFEPNDV